MIRLNSLLNLLFIFSVIVCTYTIFSVARIITTTAPDYPVYYQSTIDLTSKINPYTDKQMPTLFIYPPITNLIYLPFIIFPYSVSQGIFVVLSMLTVPAIVFISLKLINISISLKKIIVYTGLVYFSFPTKFTLGMGQVNLIALFFLMVGYYYYSKDRLKLCVFFLSIAVIAKPILCFVILFFIVQKAWKILFYFLITVFFLFLFSIFLFGLKMEIYYFQHVVPSLIDSTSGREVYYNQGIMGFVSRLTRDANLRKYLSLLLSILIFCYSGYISLKYKIQKNMQFSIFLTLLPLIDPLSWQHYFVFLIFPFLMAAMLIKKTKNFLLYIPLSIAYIFISWNFKNPSVFVNFPEVILLSNTFIGGLIFLALLFDLAGSRKVKK